MTNQNAAVVYNLNSKKKQKSDVNNVQCIIEKVECCMFRLMLLYEDI